MLKGHVVGGGCMIRGKCAGTTRAEEANMPNGEITIPGVCVRGVGALAPAFCFMCVEFLCDNG